MKPDNSKVKWLMIGVIALGLGLLLFAIGKIFGAGLHSNQIWLALVALTIALSFVRTVKIPGAKAQISVSDPVIFMAALLFGAYPAAILSGLDSGVQSVRFSKKFITWGYNVATMTVSIFISTMVVSKIFPHSIGSTALSFNPLELIPPLGMLALLHYFINTAMVAVVVAWRQNQGIVRTWLDNFQWSSISYFAGAFTAGFVCFLVKQVGVYGALSMAPLFASLYFLYKVYLGKVETKHQQVAELSSVYNEVAGAKAAWESTFNAMSDPVFIFDDRGKLNRINRAGLSLFRDQSAADLLGKSCCDLGITCNDGFCRLREMLISGTKSSDEIELRQGWFMLNGDPLKDERGALHGVVIVLNNITTQKQMREQLVYSEKMATVGQLVSGVGHEINNPLNAIIGYTNLALMDEQLPGKTKNYLEIVVGQAMRTRKSVQNLLTFARQHKPKKKLAGVNEILQQVLDLRAYEMQVNSITVDLDLGKLPNIMCDAPQLQQVFLNIIVNAEQAMLQSRGRGRLEIRTQQSESCVVISISDDGPGIEAENLKHIFEPFFTTKEVGKGTGLGLSICYGIVHEHGGRLFAHSKQGHGATFYLELPIGVEASEPVQAEMIPIKPIPNAILDQRETLSNAEKVIRSREANQFNANEPTRLAANLASTMMV